MTYSEEFDTAVRVNDLTFSYPGGYEALKNCILSLPRGSRCLLAGENGAGKTTLLQLLAGKYMVSKDAISILGRPPFHDMKLTCSGQLSYLGNTWRKDTCFAGYGVAYQGDISAGKMIFGVGGVDEARRARLVEMLDIDLYQRMTKMSDGQRRRVQICMGLLKPYDVLLLDEITVDLDVLARLRLLDFFRKECEERGATIVYSTHIFDGLDGWASHILFVQSGRVLHSGAVENLLPNSPEPVPLTGSNQEQELSSDSGSNPGSKDAASAAESATGAAPSRQKLLDVVSRWMREGESAVLEAEEKAAAAARERAARDVGSSSAGAASEMKVSNNIHPSSETTTTTATAAAAAAAAVTNHNGAVTSNAAPAGVPSTLMLKAWGLGSRHHAYYR